MTNLAEQELKNFRVVIPKWFFPSELACYHHSRGDQTVNGTKKKVARAAIEIAFIIFLFYANLLMGEFERSGTGQRRGVAWAFSDIFTSSNFGIAVAAAIVGYVVFEFLRTRF